MRDHHSPVWRRPIGAAGALLLLPALATRNSFAEKDTHTMSMASSNYLSVRADWLASGNEAALEPDMPIVDAHHHFYERQGWTYLLDEYLEDARGGHDIVASVYMQALTRYRQTEPEAMRPVGEIDYVGEVTAPLQKGGAKPQVARGIWSATRIYGAARRRARPNGKRAGDAFAAFVIW